TIEHFPAKGSYFRSIEFLVTWSDPRREQLIDRLKDSGVRAVNGSKSSLSGIAGMENPTPAIRDKEGAYQPDFYAGDTRWQPAARGGGRKMVAHVTRAGSVSMCPR